MAKKNALLALIEPEEPEADEGSEDSGGYSERKTAAAEELLAAIEAKDAEGISDAFTALYRTCKLEGSASEE